MGYEPAKDLYQKKKTNWLGIIAGTLAVLGLIGFALSA